MVRGEPDVDVSPDIVQHITQKKGQGFVFGVTRSDDQDDRRKETHQSELLTLNPLLIQKSPRENPDSANALEISSGAPPGSSVVP